MKTTWNVLFLTTSVLVAAACGSDKKSDDNPVAPAAQSPLPSASSTPTVTPPGAVQTPAPSSTPIPVAIPVNVTEAQIPNFHQVDANVYRSGRPTKAGIAALKGSSIKTIISLESDSSASESAALKANGINYISVPMSSFMRPTIGHVNEALTAITLPANQPVLVHCELGKDRTGIVIAAYHIRVDHWDVKRATDDMYNFGHSKLLSWWDSVLKQVQ